MCPVVAVIQWRGEIARYTEPGALKVCAGVRVCGCVAVRVRTARGEAGSDEATPHHPALRLPPSLAHSRLQHPHPLSPSRPTPPPALAQVAVYHGARRGDTTKEALQSADVVLTTYSTIEADYRRTMMPAKVACT